MSPCYFVRSVSALCLVITRSFRGPTPEHDTLQGVTWYVVSRRYVSSYSSRLVILLALRVLVILRLFFLVYLDTLCLVVLVEISRYIQRSTTSGLEVLQRDTTYLTLT